MAGDLDMRGSNISKLGDPVTTRGAVNIYNFDTLVSS